MESLANPTTFIKDKEPFASGGNRLCFYHPTNPAHCLKVIRPDRTPAIRRAEKKFPANLRSLSTYNENLVESVTLSYLHCNYPSRITQHLPNSFGLVQTNWGIAHETELIYDFDRRVSQTLEKYIRKNGLDLRIQTAIREFKENWSVKPPRTRDLIPHNFVVQLSEKNAKLIMIDGFGRKPKLKKIINFFSDQFYIKRRLKDFDYRMKLINERRSKK